MVRKSTETTHPAGHKIASGSVIVHRGKVRLLDRIGSVADRTGLRVFAVGGYVRDFILGNPCKDIDFLVLGDVLMFAEEVCRELKVKRHAVFEKFTTAMVPYRGWRLDFVGARKEKYHPDSRKPEVTAATLEEDLSRRDFTVNALAIALNQDNFGQLVDLLGGVNDIENKILRTPLEPETTFSEDPLRILRAIRFAAQLGFGIERKTLDAIGTMRERLSIISQERITDELWKILSMPKPSVGLRLLYVTHVMDVILPELAPLAGTAQKGKYHHKNVLEHTFTVVDNVAAMTPEPSVRFAALVHDMAKPNVKRFDPESGWTFHGHEDLGARMVLALGRRLRLPTDAVEKAARLVRLHMRPINLTDEGVTDSALRRLIVQSGEDREDLLMLCRADITSANPKKVAQYLADFDSMVTRMAEVMEKDRLRAFQSPVRGEEIMELCNLRPGPIVGKLKRAIEEAILDGVIPNEHDAARAYLLEIKDKALAKERSANRRASSSNAHRRVDDHSEREKIEGKT
jgi:poly(A) polymerase